MLFDNRVEIMDVRGGLYDPSLCSGRRGESTEHSSLIPDATLDVVSDAAFGELIGLSTFGEFDPGSGRTLAACLTHASRRHLGATPSDWRTGA